MGHGTAKKGGFSYRPVRFYFRQGRLGRSNLLTGGEGVTYSHGPSLVPPVSLRVHVRFGNVEDP